MLCAITLLSRGGGLPSEGGSSSLAITLLRNYPAEPRGSAMSRGGLPSEGGWYHRATTLLSQRERLPPGISTLLSSGPVYHLKKRARSLPRGG